VWAVLLICGGLLFLSLLSALPAGAQTEATPFMATSSRLTPPPTVYPPTQADDGAQVYFYNCMMCHGDRGQGLTDEWLNSLEPPDNNCWSSKCHDANRPGYGFKLPKQIPGVIEPGMLDQFSTAKNLHDYIKRRMPWQEPGRLSDEEYWQLTAFLMRANGFEPGKQPLDDALAAQISFQQRAPDPPDAGPDAGLLALGVGGAAGLLVVLLLFWRYRKLKNP
jgi:mono/diheme cytochrome c family protein